MHGAFFEFDAGAAAMTCAKGLELAGGVGDGLSLKSSRRKSALSQSGSSTRKFWIWAGPQPRLKMRATFLLRHALGLPAAAFEVDDAVAMRHDGRGVEKRRLSTWRTWNCPS